MVQTLRLSIGVIHVEVRWIVQVGDESDLVGSLSLVGSVDGAGVCVTVVGPPLYPVDVILKQSNSPDVVLLTHNYRHTKPKESQYYKMHEQSIIKNIITRVKMHQ